MGFKMRGWSPFTKKASDKDLDRYDQAYYEYHKGDRSKESGKISFFCNSNFRRF